MTVRSRTSGPRGRRGRRGVALVLVVVLLAFVHLATIASLGGTADHAWAGGARVRTLRAFFAAESAFNATAAALARARPIETGEIGFAAGQGFEILAIPDPDGGELVLEGRSDGARRRLTIDVE